MMNFRVRPAGSTKLLGLPRPPTPSTATMRGLRKWIRFKGCYVSGMSSETCADAQRRLDKWECAKYDNGIKQLKRFVSLEPSAKPQLC